MNSSFNKQDKETARRLLLEVVMHAAMDHTIDALNKLARCCPNCCHFNHTLEVCTCRQVNIRPPAHIIAFGCDEYMNKDEIPF